MFEFTWRQEEVWRSVGGGEPIPQPPPDAAISGASLLFWEEHCVECSIPDCYTTCRLYVARKDQKCARFVYGIYPNDQVRGLLPYGADISFRRWAKLEAKLGAAPRLFSMQEIEHLARWEDRFEGLASGASDVIQVLNPKRRINGAYTALRNRWLHQRAFQGDASRQAPTAFYIKFFNPGTDEFLVNIEYHQERLVFRDGVLAKRGWNEALIPAQRFRLASNKHGRILLSLANDREARLIFTWLDFVSLATAGAQPVAAPTQTTQTTQGRPAPATKVKCVVWDLDNTLWTGVIGDVGPESVIVNETAVQTVRALDERGILQSIASKNTYEIAWAKIEAMGLGDYFLYPAIHWGPKSQSLKSIADELNINVDTFVLIDDSPFERAEVTTALPQVRALDVPDLEGILGRPEFDVMITEVSRTRRLSYLAEAQRKRVAASWNGDFDDFLRSCEFVIEIGTPEADERGRCLELLQRTNQLNLSTRRYSDREFDDLLGSSEVETFVLRCADKFGDYGLVGFASVDVGGEAPVLKDFVLSCRVAQKRVEEAFLAWYGRRALTRGATRLEAVFIATDRNQPLRSALSVVPFHVVSTAGSTQILRLPLSESIAIPDVVRVVERTSALSDG